MGYRFIIFSKNRPEVQATLRTSGSIKRYKNKKEGFMTFRLLLDIDSGKRKDNVQRVSVEI